MRVILIALIGLILSACVSTGIHNNDNSNNINNLPYQKTLTIMFNTAHDNTVKSWQTHTSDYRLVTHNTRVNAQGRPCRDFVLDITHGFLTANNHMTGTVCRYNNHWINE